MENPKTSSSSHHHHHHHTSKKRKTTTSNIDSDDEHHYQQQHHQSEEDDDDDDDDEEEEEEEEEELNDNHYDHHDYRQLYIDAQTKLKQTQQLLRSYKKEIGNWKIRFHKLEQKMQNKKQKMRHVATAAMQKILHEINDNNDVDTNDVTAAAAATTIQREGNEEKEEAAKINQNEQQQQQRNSQKNQGPKTPTKRDQNWEEMFVKLLDFQKHYGHCNVQRNDVDKKLSRWVRNQRTSYTSNTLPEERKNRLDSIGFAWNLRRGKKHNAHDDGDEHDDLYGYSRTPCKRKSEERWEDMFTELQIFKERYGHSYVMNVMSDDENAVDDNQKRLAAWVANQQALCKLNELDESRRMRLDSIGFLWTSNEGKTQKKYSHDDDDDDDDDDDPFVLPTRPSTFDQQWNNMYNQLLVFEQEYGHCNVKRTDKLHPRLGKWISNQRTAYRSNNLPEERIERLESIGFVWNTRK